MIVGLNLILRLFLIDTDEFLQVHGVSYDTCFTVN